jgi:hypothetical protein
MIAPGDHHAREAERKRQSRGRQRAEDRQQDDEDDREADPLRALEIVLREVLHAGPERLLAHEVRLDPGHGRGQQLVAEVDGHVRRGVALALDRERHDGDRRRGRLALGPGGRLPGQLDVRQPGGDAAHAVHLGADGRRAGALAAGEHRGELVLLGALEAGDVLGHDLGLRSRHLEPAAGQVIGLLGGERKRGQEQEQPCGKHGPAAPLQKPCQSVHQSLHPRPGIPGVDPPFCDPRH